ncbi:hypothetical protein [Putridiphycobacter roseus]|nr:hypothetical protein [Putridiphycobacter roseus]
MLNALSAFTQFDKGPSDRPFIPPSIDSFFLHGYINLKVLRNTSNFLTNRDIRLYDNQTIPRRKNAFIRHVKHLSEICECHYQDHQKINTEIINIVFELYFLEASFKQKTIRNAETTVSFYQKLDMLYATYRSKNIFKYKIPNQNPALNFAPKNSPFYSNLNQNIPLHKQFASLAKQKKIKQKKEMVVLFKSLSLSGSAPKINTRDLDLDNEWVLKWGDEVHTDILGSRIFAALGYDVDHPYFYGKDKLTLVFEEDLPVKNASELLAAIYNIYHIDLSLFVSNFGIISKEMAAINKQLAPFIGKPYVRFFKCSIEARPDRVKRIGSFLPFEASNANRKALKGALLAHHFIGNWDTREANTLLTTVHLGNYKYKMSAVFSDLGTSLGVSINPFNRDFKVGLVNELPWEVVKRKKNKIVCTNRINAMLPFYKNANYDDLLWMANKIAKIDAYNLRKMIKKAHWPYPIAVLYFHKLASRRASILKAFNITDPHPIPFDKKVNIVYKEVEVVKNGQLIIDYEKKENPESFLNKKGRLRNYGN